MAAADGFKGKRRAQAEGRYKGRPKDTERNDGIARLLAAGQSWSAIQRATGCSRATIAKVAKRQEEAAWELPQAARLFWLVGICGGYTTFSTFSLDAWYLIERGQTWTSLTYMLTSVVLSVTALVAALHLMRILP